MNKLSLDRDKIDQSRKVAEQIAGPILQQIERHTTVSIERSVLRLLGVEGSAEEAISADASQGCYPLVNLVVDKIGTGRLAKGAGFWFGLAAVHHPKLSATQLARKIASGEIDLEALPEVSVDVIDQACQKLMEKPLERLRAMREIRQDRPVVQHSRVPLKYIIVATGNIHEDVRQAQAAAEMGADIIAVIRSTAQSLLDYVPEGETTEGYGGTYATQANFRLMRQALDESEKKLRRRIGLTNYSSGLCMPEIAVLGAMEGVDYLLNDAMYGILFRDINMKRNFIDQHFSRRICSLSGITIQTGEDNYLTTADSYKYWYQIYASHFVNFAFAKAAGLSDTHVAFGHAFEMDPSIEDSMLFEWAQAQLVREVFPRSPIKFMPPTKHKSGDIFFSYLYDGMFNLAGILTGQSIQLLGMHTEAIHNPFIQDRYLSLKNANYVFNAAKSAFDEVSFQPHGKIARRARQVLDDGLSLLKKIGLRGLFRAIEEGAFANVRRSQEEGKGLSGVIAKTRDYYTPLRSYLTPKLPTMEEEIPVRRTSRGSGGNKRRDRENLASDRQGSGRQDGGRSERQDRPDRQDRQDRSRDRQGDRGRSRQSERGDGRGSRRSERSGNSSRRDENQNPRPVEEIVAVELADAAPKNESPPPMPPETFVEPAEILQEAAPVVETIPEKQESAPHVEATPEPVPPKEKESKPREREEKAAPAPSAPRPRSKPLPRRQLKIGDKKPSEASSPAQSEVESAPSEAASATPAENADAPEKGGE